MELELHGVRITVYKVQLYAGVGGNNKEIGKLITKVMNSGNRSN